MVPFPTLFPWSTVASGPKHSTSVPSRTGSAVALSVDVKGPLVPKPLSGTAVKGWLAPLGVHELTAPVDKCARVHRLLLPPTLHMVVPLPVIVHLKVKVSPGQVGGAAVNCAATSPGDKYASSLYQGKWNKRQLS